MEYLWHLFFSFSGRIKRSEFWTSTIALWIACGVCVVVFNGSEGLLLLLLFPALWSGLAIQTKRWHDRNKYGAWILINFIPYLGVLWSLFELGFLPARETLI
jgi:uncharacterized membrane protein YhaH (DUF805 family)